MKRIYISGPMTGYPNLNFPAFNAEAARLRALGYEVVNPVELNPDPDTSRQECMKRDIRGLLDCDTIALLPGWDRSKGASLEQYVANAVGIHAIRAEYIQSARQ
jgi:hypothetical protein